MDLEKIKELRSKITASPWVYGSKMFFDGMDLKERWIDGPTIRSNYTDDTPEGQTANADCEFVASSPEIVDYLLSIIEQAEKALSDTNDELAKVVNKMCGGAVKDYIFEDTRKVYYSVNEALKAIRGN